MTEAHTQATTPGKGTRAGDEIQDMITRASQKIAAGDFAAASSLLDDAIRRAPGSSELLAHAGLLTLRSGDSAKAEFYLLKALQLSSRNKDVLHDLALFYWGAGRFGEARGMLRRLVDVDPGDADSLNDLAVFEDQGGDITEATTAFKAAVILPGATRKVFENCFEFLLRIGDVFSFRSVMGTYLSRYGDDDVTHKWQNEAAQATTVLSAATRKEPCNG